MREDWPKSLYGLFAGSRATAFKTDNGRSALVAGTGLHVPLRSLPCTALTASTSWYASRSFAKRELMFRPKSGSGNTILTVGKDPSGEAGRANTDSAPPAAAQTGKSIAGSDKRAGGHYSITSSARTSKCCGTLRPSCLAVLRLMAKWNFVDLLTGRSAGMGVITYASERLSGAVL